MATFTVTTFDDIVDAGDNQLSLREAITLANQTNDGDRIDFAAAEGTLVLTSPLTVSHSLEIDGSGLTIDATGLAPNGGDLAVFIADALPNPETGQIETTVLDLHALEIVGDVLQSTYHHGVLGNNTSLELSDVTIRNMSGSGVMLEGEGSVVLRDSTITGNYEGGINAQGVNITHSTISDNWGGLRGLDPGVYSSAGVAIYDSVISGNLAGGIHAQGNVGISRSAISDNQSSSFYDGSGTGGGLFAQGDIVISDSAFINNKASVSGGAIFMAGPGETRISDTVFEGNLTSYREAPEGAPYLGGGAVANNHRARNTIIRDSEFSNNQTDGDGGAVLRNYGANLIIAESIFTANSATQGGALALSGGGSALIGEDSSFILNTAEVDGGAISIRDDGNLTVVFSDFAGNRAGSDGGAIASRGGIGVELSLSSFDGNAALGEDAGRTTGRGGVVAILDGGSLTVDRSDMAHNNAASAGGAIAVLGRSPDQSSRVSIVDTDINFNDTGFTRADGLGGGGDGGGIFLENASLVLERSSVSGNDAQNRGGGIHAQNAQISLINSTLADNTTGEFGGGIFSYQPGDQGMGSLEILNSTITGNNAAQSGGGLYTGTPVFFTNSIIALNESSNGGEADADLSGNIVSNGANIFSTSIAGLAQGDVTDASLSDLLLGPLASNGGPTSTVALGLGSIALDQAERGPAPDIDQRGLARDMQPDIGAFERQAETSDQDPFDFLPELADKQRVDPSQINGTDPALLRGTGEIEIEVYGQSGAFDNSLGYYIFGPDGLVDEAGLLFESLDDAQGLGRLPQLDPLQQFGLFLIQDGFNRNPLLGNEHLEAGEFHLRGFNGGEPLDIDIDTTPRLFFESFAGQETEIDGALLFATSSAPGEQHLNPREGLAAISALDQSGTLLIAFEDKKPGEASNDQDFEDVVIAVNGLEIRDLIAEGGVV